LSQQDRQKDIKILCQVLRQLNRLSGVHWDTQKDLEGSDLTLDARQNYAKLIVSKHPMKEKDFEGFEQQVASSGVIKLGKFYLPPLDSDKEFIPLLWAEGDFKKEPPAVGFRIGMYRFPKGRRPQVFGFRFEMHDGKSNHDYFHVQVTSEPHPEIDCDSTDWGPDHIPCVLVPANNVVSLVFCILISFYGRRISEQMISHLNIDGKYKEPLQFLPPRNKIS